MTRVQAQQLAGALWDEAKWEAAAGPSGGAGEASSMSSAAWAHLTAVAALQATFPYDAVRDLQACGNTSRGRMLVDMKDRLACFATIIQALFRAHTAAVPAAPAADTASSEAMLGRWTLVPEHLAGQSTFINADGTWRRIGEDNDMSGTWEVVGSRVDVQRTTTSLEAALERGGKEDLAVPLAGGGEAATTWWQMKRTINPGAVLDGDVLPPDALPPVCYSLCGVGADGNLYENEAGASEEAYTASPPTLLGSPAGPMMSLAEFKALVIDTMGCDVEPEQCDNHFYETLYWPDDEDDEAKVASIRLNVGQFAAALVRIANDVVVMGGDVTAGLGDQFVSLLRGYGAKEAGKAAASGVVSTVVTAEAIEAAASAPLRDASAFEAPEAFKAGGPVRCFMDLVVGVTDAEAEEDAEAEADVGAESAAEAEVVKALGGRKADKALGGRIVFEVDPSTAPNTAYNFYCLCTGERGAGEMSGEKLCFRSGDHPIVGCGIHRIVQGMCIQGGDFVCNDGEGGESVYGDVYKDENFTMNHDAPYLLSSANAGPDTNSSQFFITLAAAPSLDGKHCAFGRVVEGSEVVDRIGQMEVDEDTEAPLRRVAIVDCGAGDG